MWAGEAAMRKSIPALRQAAYKIISDLPRIQKSRREKALVVIPPGMRICATNGEQRVQVLILVVQGLSQKQRQLMQQYFELVDWQGLKLPSAERRQRDSLTRFERSVEVWKDCQGWIHLKTEVATLGEELPPAESLPAKRKEKSPDPTKRDASREEFGRRALAGGNLWKSLSCLLTLLESFDKNNPEMGTDIVTRQMHQKTVMLEVRKNTMTSVLIKPLFCWRRSSQTQSRISFGLGTQKGNSMMKSSKMRLKC